MRSRPCSSTSSSSSASCAISGVTTPSCRTSATSRTRRRIRFATRGVPRERRAISSAASSAISTARIRAERRTMRVSSSGLVVVEPEGHAEAVAERRRQQPRPRGRADEREGRQVERERARRGALAHDDVDAEVLEGRVEHLLGGAGEPVDLVDEEDVALLQRGQDRGHVLPLDGRPGDGADPDAELLADHVGEARLAEAGRAGEQDVVERLAARASRRERDRELLLDPLLADEVVEPLRPERAVELLLVDLQVGGEELGHAAFRRATRTRSSAGSSGSTSASARSASTSE